MELIQKIMIPPAVIDRYEQLYELVQNKSDNGRLAAKDVAEYMGRSVQWFRDALANGTVPFAFADGTKGRVTSYIGILPFWQYETQCNLFMAQNILQGGNK